MDESRDLESIIEECQIRVPTIIYNCKFCHNFSTVDKKIMYYHINFKNIDRNTIMHSHNFIPITYRCNSLIKGKQLKDIPNELLYIIMSKLHERDRRQFKQTCKQILKVYQAFVSISKNNPPINTRLCVKWMCQEPCNAIRKYQGPLMFPHLKYKHSCHPGNKAVYQVLHECVCTYHRFTFNE